MKIAIAQINTYAGDFEETSLRMESFTRLAVEQGAQIVVFPMAVLTGPLPVDYSYREGFRIDLHATLRHLAASLACPCLVPVVSEMDNEPYHEVMLLKDGQITALRLQAYMQKRDGASDQDHPMTAFELDGLSFALAQSYEDLDELIDAAVRPDVTVFISDYSYALDDASSALGSSLSENRYKADALALDSWFVAAGSLGGYGLQIYSGSSFVLSPRGNLVASAPAFEESLLLAEVGKPSEDAKSNEAHVLEPEIYNRSLHLWQALSLGLHDYFVKQGKSDATLSLDGSVASCLLAALASDALGPTHVHALITATNSRRSVAQSVAQALHINVEPCAIDLANAPEDEAMRDDLVKACIAHVARNTASIPLGSADKTFLALEASSLTCRIAELMPFGDVYRTDLIELSHLRNTISPIFPVEAFGIYDVPQVEGVEELGSTPETRLKTVDVVLATHIEWERSLSDVVARQGNEAMCKSLVTLMRSLEATRNVWPLCLSASSRPLFSVRMPIGLAWKDRVRSEEERREAKKNQESLAGSSHDQSDALSDTPSLSDLMKDLEVELQGELFPQGASNAGLENALGEILGLLQDLSQGSDGDHPPIEGPFGPLTWGSPFSEN